MAHGGRFTKLSDGDWGVRIVGITRKGAAVRVNVTKRNGETTDVTADVFWTGDDSAGQPVALARVRQTRGGRWTNAKRR